MKKKQKEKKRISLFDSDPTFETTDIESHEFEKFSEQILIWKLKHRPTT